jgi:TFIIF-interacting CTD phosphatase-like protein
MNIILDLDSTVISSLDPKTDQPKGLKGYDMDGEYMVYERPGLQKFLDYLFGNFNVAVWTAASKDYALFIVNNILIGNRPNRHLKFVLFDYHGDISEEMTGNPKDLGLVYKLFKGFTKDNTIIVDDYEAVYSPQMENSYPIPPFEANAPDATQDKELLKLQNKLTRVKSGEVPNQELLTEVTLNKAIQKIYDAARSNSDSDSDSHSELD